jgi:hypothetical protein
MIITPPKICTARAAGDTDFGGLYLIVPSYLGFNFAIKT